ncbi:beta-lactamase family protein [Streptomyces sp. NBC_00536]|uniref:serine hydrolase domain-containing protein n=1 Tax=Streptomyces sp. NBC_00536 TaxID=2975769 RepID=UPI002E802D3F|nr:serine hydrolase domain-containing protein [Streptomyces sp. NBC_00536]WUC82039.1 beta-lactamase family protein [Streptomyces sp. NBC_00536]
MEAHQAAERLRELAHDHTVPGAQLTVHRAGESLSLAAGAVRAGGPEAVTTATGFAYGSVTKAFTATVVARLESDGDLELDDPVGEYLAEFDAATDEAISSVTLRNLLSHTAGLIADHEPDRAEDASLARYAASMATTGSLHEPGGFFSYSNSGYNILGRVIEAVTDMTWRQALGNLLLRPLAIQPLFLHGPQAPGRTLADCHTVRPGERVARPADLYVPPSWAPAAGLAGSADDLIALARLHLGTHPATAAAAGARGLAGTGVRVPAADAFGMADGWGPGLAHYASPEGDWLGHDGTVDGSTSHLRFHPASGTAVALTTNSTTGTLMWADVVDWLRERGIPVGDYRPVLPPQAPPGADLRALTGEFRNGDTYFAVRAHGDAGDGRGLRLSDGTGLVADLTLYDGLVFTARRADAEEAPYAGRFVLDPATGEAALMQLGGRSARRVAAL